MRKIKLLFFIFFSCSLFSEDIREGSSRYGNVLLNYDGKNIREGSGRYGNVLCNFDGKYLREGSGRYGTALLNVDGSDIPEPILAILCL